MTPPSAAPPKFASEAELCAAFIAALPDGWTVYAETAGWDILLVRADGIQVGIEAKLRLNLEVVEQACVTRQGSLSGPDYRAVLTPGGCGVLPERLSAITGITHIRMWHRGPEPGLPGADPFSRYNDPRIWHDWAPERREPLPEYVPDVVAGDSSPIQLSEWKVAALRIIALIERFGSVARADFRALGISPSRWLTPDGWLARTDTKGQFAVGPRCPDFKAQHPVVYPQIVADLDTWCPAHRKAGQP